MNTEITIGMAMQINKKTNKLKITTELNEVYSNIFDNFLTSTSLLLKTLENIKNDEESETKIEFMSKFITFYLATIAPMVDDNDMYSVDLNELYKYIYGSYLDNVFGD